MQSTAVKSLPLSCSFAWPPKNSNHVATVSISGEDDFSQDAYLQLHSVDVKDQRSTAMPTVSKCKLPDRAQSLDWTSHGGREGCIAAGLVDGQVLLYGVDLLLHKGSQAGPSKLVQPDEAAIVGRITHHTDAIRAIHFNPVQPTILATGGADKELMVWNINDPKNPAPVPVCAKGTKYPSELFDIKWNPKVFNILATASANGQVVIWDLKSKRTTASFNVNVTTPQQSAAATALTWHPTQATLLAVARDEPYPVVQIWDVKKAMQPVQTLPLRELSGHTGGLLSIAWCPSDTTLLASCARDGQTLFWNPDSGERVGSINVETPNAISWIPGVSAVICVASFDNHFGLYSTLAVGPVAQAPKWLVRPCSPAVFGFGGKMALPATVGQATQEEYAAAQAQRQAEGGDPSEIAAPNPTTIPLVAAPVATEFGVSQRERSFQEGIQTYPAWSPEWLEWVKSIVEPISPAVFVAAECVMEGSRAPLLRYLNVNAEAATENATRLTTNASSLEQQEQDVEDEYNSSSATSSSSKKKTPAEYEETMSQCIISGCLNDAIELALSHYKFEDAFGVALVADPEQIRRVHAAWAAYESSLNQQQRVIPQYLTAVAQKQWDTVSNDAARRCVLQQSQEPWRQVLGLFATWADATGFSEATLALAHALEVNELLADAASVAAIGGHVDRSLALFSQAFCSTSQRDVIDSATLTHLGTLIEHINSCGASTECGPYSRVLLDHAKDLATESDFELALYHASRAGSLGLSEATVVADRLRFLVQPNEQLLGQIPFGPSRAPVHVILPDASDYILHNLYSALQTQQQEQQQTQTQQTSQQQQHQQTHATTAAAPQQQHHHQQTTQHQHQHQHAASAAVSSQQQQQHQQQHASMQHQHQHQGQAPTRNTATAPQPPTTNNFGPAAGSHTQQQHYVDPHHQQQQQHQQVHQQHQHHVAATTTTAPVAAHQHQHQHAHHHQQQHQPPQNTTTAPPPTRNTMPPPTTSTNRPGAGAPLTHNVAPATHHAPPTTHNAPTTTTAPMMNPGANRGGGAPPATTTHAHATTSSTTSAASLAPVNINYSHLAPNLQQIAHRLIEVCSALIDKRKRDTVEKAINIFVQRASSLQPRTVEIMSGFVQSLGTPSAKEQWALLVDNCWTDVQAFNSIKFAM